VYGDTGRGSGTLVDTCLEVGHYLAGVWEVLASSGDRTLHHVGACWSVIV
jgi:hypothetical protein